MVPSMGLNCSSRGRNIPHPQKVLEAAILEGSVNGQGQGNGDMTTQHKTLGEGE